MLTQAVEAYIGLKQALGYSFRSTASVLRSFARFAQERGDTHVKTSTVLPWSRQASSLKERDNRLKTVVAFAKHAHAEDSKHEIPPSDVYGYRKRRPVPFIFTPTQVADLVDAASRLDPQGWLRPLTYSTLFGLLACTGLRISEPLLLLLSDVTADGLIVRKTKFRKSRLIPLHDTATQALDNYLSQRCRLASTDKHVFLGHDGEALRYSAVHQVFRKLVQSLGLPLGLQRPKPTPQSFRHTFAVRALESCPNSRQHVGKHLVALSTYLGHASVAATYWYLEATPELLGDILAANESLFKGVSP